MGQNHSSGKKSVAFCIRPCCMYCLIKNLVRKTQWDKTWSKGKRVQCVHMILPLNSTSSCKYLLEYYHCLDVYELHCLHISPSTLGHLTSMYWMLSYLTCTKIWYFRTWGDLHNLINNLSVIELQVETILYFNDVVGKQVPNSSTIYGVVHRLPNYNHF